MLEFKLPAIGEGVVEGEIVRWLKQPGEAVAANEAIVEVMTDKATVEIPAPRSAVVKEHRAAEGDICAVGQTIAMLEEGNVPATSTKPIAGSSPANTPTSTAPAPQPTIQATRAVPPAAPVTTNGGRVLATPAARALAREHGIDLTAVAGEHGRITKSHVQRVHEQPTASTPGSAPTQAPATTVARTSVVADATPEYLPFRGMRRKIAEGMSKAYLTAVHYTYVEEIDVRKLVVLRDQAKAAAEAEGVKLNYLPFIVKAVILALRRFPIVNAELDEANARIALKKHYSIGIATTTDQGLTVPVVHQADRLSMLELAREIARVSEAARKGSATRDELTGSTFTITSLGQIGGLLATPILNYPEVGILGVHAIRKVPIVDEQDRIVVGDVMNLSVSLDHRIVDGYEGASFLQEVKRYLEEPSLMLLASI